MSRSGHRGGSDAGFTLLEVLLAAAILAMSATTIVAIYIHSLQQAAYARDLTYASSAARNALAEAVAIPDQEPASGDLPDRPNLRITLEVLPCGEDLLADTMDVRVVDNAQGDPVCRMQTKRAVYIQPEEPESPEEEEDSEEEPQ